MKNRKTRTVAALFILALLLLVVWNSAPQGVEETPGEPDVRWMIHRTGSDVMTKGERRAMGSVRRSPAPSNSPRGRVCAASGSG
jgi:hypothetical protein